MEPLRVPCLLFGILLLRFSFLCAETVTKTETETIEYGPITIVKENLAENTVEITDEMSAQLNERIERTAATLGGNIDVVVANAIDQLVDTIYRTNQLMEDMNCEHNLSVDELRYTIGEQLSNCTVELNDLLEAFRKDGKEIINTVQTYVQNIAKLPVVCQLLSVTSLDLPLISSSNCYTSRMADINKDLSLTMNSASMMLTRTRQQSQLSLASAQACASNVVSEMNSYLDNEIANCN